MLLVLIIVPLCTPAAMSGMSDVVNVVLDFWRPSSSNAVSSDIAMPTGVRPSLSSDFEENTPILKDQIVRSAHTNEVLVTYPAYGYDGDGDGQPDPMINVDAILRHSNVNMSALQDPKITANSKQITVEHADGQIVIPVSPPTPRFASEIQDGPENGSDN